MVKPTWLTVMGIFMVLIGGCGAYNDYQEINVRKMMAFKDKVFSEAKSHQQREVEVLKDSLESIKTDTTGAEAIELDTTDTEVVNIETTTTVDTSFLDLVGDDIVMDENNNVDVGASLQNWTRMSDYRMDWTRRFGIIGMFISIAFIIIGVLMWKGKKYITPIFLAAVSISIAFGIFQVFTFLADTESSEMIRKWGNFGIYAGIFVDILLLIVFMVMDKSYFKSGLQSEDYYD